MKLKYYLLVLFLITTPALSEAQYLNRVYDFDTTLDFGFNVFIKSNGNYSVIGSAKKSTTKITTMEIDPTGNKLNAKSILESESFSFFRGNAGALKKIQGDYIMPIEGVRGKMGGDIHFSGLSRIKENGDTLWVRWYPDTLVHQESAFNCNVMPDGGFLLSSGRYFAGGVENMKGVLRRVDNAGNVLWMTVHSKASGFGRCEYIGDGKILVGSADVVPVWQPGGGYFYYNYPWFMIYDTLGNLVKDTLYGGKYVGGGSIFKDKNGGYIHYGLIDTIAVDPLSDYHFASYLAHLDDSFRITWRRTFNFKKPKGFKYINNVKQLRDSSYLIVGDFGHSLGWAAKIDRNGWTIWDNYYLYDPDTTYPWSYLVDAAEGADGRIVMTGSTDDYQNITTRGQDVWVVVVDSMGCIIPNCAPTSVNEISKVETAIQIYPNPTTGAFTINTSEKGMLFITNLQGQTILTKELKKGKNELNMPEVAAGVYIARFTNSGGGMNVARLVYQW